MDGGILSQDEINALLSGVSSGDTPVSDSAAQPGPAVQEETAEQKTEPQAEAAGSDMDLTDVEKDAIGEVANISMGTSATTLYSLVNHKVNITTPVVSLATWDNLMSEKDRPCVFIQIQYTAGLDGSNILILKEKDVKVIADLMMGGDGTNIEGELGELHLSAISEAMNQMMGSSATSLSQMLGKMIDISPPVAQSMSIEEAVSDDDISDFLKGTFVKISFRMQIGDLVDSTILQLYPIDFAKELVTTFLSGNMADPEPAAAAEPEKAEPKVEAFVPPRVEPQPAPVQPVQPNMGMNPNMMNMNAGMGMMPNMQNMPNMQGMPNMGMMPGVNYQPAQFESFDQSVAPTVGNENIDIIMDVPLEVTVELGRTSKSISEILDFAPGTIIELDKIAGEPIDVLVNGKFVAKGEVVVIEESFGIRVTEIIK